MKNTKSLAIVLKLYIALLIFLVAVKLTVRLFLLVHEAYMPQVLDLEDLPSFIMGGRICAMGQIKNLYSLPLQQKIYETVLKETYPSIMSYLSTHLVAQNSGLLPFRNPPFVAVLMSPLGFLNAGVAYSVLAICSLFSILLVSVLFYKKNKKKLLYFLLFSGLFVPIARSMALGQIDFLLFLICSLVLYLTIKKPPNFPSEKISSFLSGFLTGLLFVKPQFLLLAPVHLIINKKKSHFAAGFLLSFASLLIWCFALIGRNFFSQYANFLLLTESKVYGTDTIYSFSVQPLLRVLPVVGGSAVTYIAGSGVLFIILLFLFVQRNRALIKAGDAAGEEERFYALVLFGYLSVLLCAVHVQVQDLVILMVPLFEVLYVVWISHKTKPGAVDCVLLAFFIIFIFCSSTTGSGFINMCIIIVALWASYLNMFKKETNGTPKPISRLQ